MGLTKGNRQKQRFKPGQKTICINPESVGKDFSDIISFQWSAGYE
jgi:hypothetical protein